ncbi:IS66 family transposase [Hallella multisaccharivorax]|uniref:IS66 family transposase n=1 Tax=Hallella multisaccharivorax TaxID=310514 RepID=UPI0012EA1077
MLPYADAFRLWHDGIESICCMLREDGFNMNRKTADGLFRKTVRIPESLYKALRIAVRQSDYLNIDGTYHRILSEKKTDMKDENSDKEASGEDLANRKDMDKNDSAQETGMN